MIKEKDLYIKLLKKWDFISISEKNKLIIKNNLIFKTLNTLSEKINIVIIYCLLFYILNDTTLETDDYNIYEIKIIFINHIYTKITKIEQTFFNSDKIYYDVIQSFFKNNYDILKNNINYYLNNDYFSTIQTRLNSYKRDNLDNLIELIKCSTLILNLYDTKFNYKTKSLKHRHNEIKGFLNIIVHDKYGNIIFVDESHKVEKIDFNNGHKKILSFIENMNIKINTSDIIIVKTHYKKVNGFIINNKFQEYDFNYIEKEEKILLENITKINFDVFKSLQELSPKLFSPNIRIKNIDNIHYLRVLFASLAHNIQNILFLSEKDEKEFYDKYKNRIIIDNEFNNKIDDIKKILDLQELRINTINS